MRHVKALARALVGMLVLLMLTRIADAPVGYFWAGCLVIGLWSGLED